MIDVSEAITLIRAYLERNPGAVNQFAAFTATHREIFERARADEEARYLAQFDQPKSMGKLCREDFDVLKVDEPQTKPANRFDPKPNKRRNRWWRG